jgi:hypothetical protein
VVLADGCRRGRACAKISPAQLSGGHRGQWNNHAVVEGLRRVQVPFPWHRAAGASDQFVHHRRRAVTRAAGAAAPRRRARRGRTLQDHFDRHGAISGRRTPRLCSAGVAVSAAGRIGGSRPSVTWTVCCACTIEDAGVRGHNRDHGQTYLSPDSRTISPDQPEIVNLKGEHYIRPSLSVCGFAGLEDRREREWRRVVRDLHRVASSSAWTTTTAGCAGGLEGRWVGRDEVGDRESAPG